MSRWFRMYDELLDDAKVQMLSPKLFKAWVNLLCLSSRSSGVLPNVETIAFSLRVDEEEASSLLADLIGRGLIDRIDDQIKPHNWDNRQYKSDVSTDRVKQFRQRKRNVSPDVSETPPDTDTDTEDNPDRSSHTTSGAQGRGVAVKIFSKSDLDKIEELIFPEVGGMPCALVSDISPIVGCMERGATETDVLNGIRAAVSSGLRASRWKAFAGWIDRATQDRKTGPPSSKANSADQADVIARFAAKNGLSPDGQPISN